MVLIDERSTKGIHIEEKIIRKLFAYGVDDLSHLVVLIIFETMDVLMNTASCCLLCLFYLVPRRKVCFGELFGSLSCAAWIILVSFIFESYDMW